MGGCRKGVGWSALGIRHLDLDSAFGQRIGRDYYFYCEGVKRPNLLCLDDEGYSCAHGAQFGARIKSNKL